MSFRLLDIRESEEPKKNYKFIATLYNEDTDKVNKIKFGDKRYNHFTEDHMDMKRRENYRKRHINKENWTKSGRDTKGYWSWNLLWRFPTYKEAIKHICKDFE